MGWEVSIASDQDMCGAFGVWHLGVDGIGEARAHLRYSEWEDILETWSDGSLNIVTLEKILRNRVEEDASLGVVWFMIVDEKFFDSISVHIQVLDWISLIDSTINKFLVDNLTSILSDLVDLELLGEEFSCEDDVRLRVLREFNDFELDVRACGDQVFSPRGLLETFDGVFKPDELTLVSFSVWSGSDKVQKTITIHVNPLSSVIEEAWLLGSQLILLLKFGNVRRISGNNEDISIVMEGDEESIWDN